MGTEVSRTGSNALILRGHGRIPLSVKLLFTAFVCVLVPYYWHDYGPTNFLYYCDVALFMALVAVWTEKSIWASMPAVGILVPQALWMVDFLGGFVGLHVTGMTAYMFSDTIPLLTRALSLFHFWLPLFLVWLLVASATTAEPSGVGPFWRGC